jgi:hypothetical protein
MPSNAAGNRKKQRISIARHAVGSRMAAQES